MAQSSPSTQEIIKGARNILVGKVPMPMEQCHEITKALIYKHISVDDIRSEKDGYEPTYFLGPAAEYRWDQLLEMRHSATEVARRYQAGLAYIGGRTDIPAAFQSIYRDAFLPYKDAPTLRAFLEKVNEFKIDNTETIGDAFEHLLRDTGAQGKAGQFRTPRHIIDFIVGIVNPQSSETILDPACGTGGFLAAAWQHIRRQEGAEFSVPVKNRLAANLVGYDLAPDMVKLAAIHLFLQHQQDPRIEVYDTISHDRHWNDHYDVILANPPFMSPAGIVAAHSRFYTQAKRTEVLFVDYIASHLTAHGRAGVIVPEGIIFQSGKAYKQLRKLLVDNYLAAVISLPGGVFQPYSGVKTSILILDKSRAAQSDGIAFFKVENDGFDLGAQRRPIDRNDLPAVAAELGEYLRRRRAGASLADFAPQTGRVVSKERLAADGDYNLSGERYRESVRPAGKWPLAALGEVAEVIAGQSPPGDSYNAAGVGEPFYQGKTEFGAMFLGEPVKWTTDPKRFAYEGDVLMSVRAPVGPVNLATQKIAIGRGLAAIRPKDDRLIKLYAYYVLRSMAAEITGSAGASFASINKGEIEQIEIPLPPLSVQQELVAEVEGYERVIAGARQVAANWRPRVAVNAEWPVVGLGEVILGKPEYGSGARKAPYDGKVRYVRITDITDNGELKASEVVSPSTIEPEYFLEPGDLLIARSGSVGRTYLHGNPTGVHQYAGYLIRFRLDPAKAIPEYVYCITQSEIWREWIISNSKTGTLTNINAKQYATFRFPLPPLPIQEELVAGLEEERWRVLAAGELAELVGARLRGAVGRVWG